MSQMGPGVYFLAEGIHLPSKNVYNENNHRLCACPIISEVHSYRIQMSGTGWNIYLSIL